MKFYESIDDLPIYNWNKINTTGELKYLLIEPKELTDDDKFKLIEVFEFMQKEVFEKFGHKESFKEAIQEDKRYRLWKIEGELGDPASKIYAKTYEEEIKNRKKTTFEESIALLQKKLGFYFTSKTMTTTDYFNHIYLEHG